MKKILVYISAFAIGFTMCGCGAPAPSDTGEITVQSTAPIQIPEETTLPVVEPPSTQTEPPYKEYEYFSPDVSYASQYLENGEVMPHLFFRPSTADDYEKIPLILWLHGSGEQRSSEAVLESSGILKALADWELMQLEGMNAYIVAPHLVDGEFWSPYWRTETSANNIQTLLDYYTKHYNVDPDQIVVAGHSLGGQGAIYLPQVLPDTFCAAAPISVYHPSVNLTNTDIPVWCFEGQRGYGEDQASINYAVEVARIYGAHSVTSLPAGHGDMPMTVCRLDSDTNGRNDLLEWFAAQMENNARKSESTN